MPFIVIENLDIIKTITVKEFNKFTDRYVSGGSFRDGVHNGYPPGLFFLQGEQWQQIRHIVSPTFSSKKLKKMAPLIETSCNALFDKMTKVTLSGVNVNILRIFGQFTMQAILATAFGLQIDILNDEANELTTAAAGVFNSVGISPAFQLFFEQIPYANTFLWFLGKHSSLGRNSRIILSTGYNILQARKKQAQKQLDLLQLLLDAKTCTDDIKNGSLSSNEVLTDEQIISTSFNFLLAGYETTSNCLGFTAYLLATNPDKQDKLCQCIEDYYLENEDISLYDAAHSIEYLEWVIQESLRLYPPAANSLRYCRETCTIDDLTIPKGCHVIIPIDAIHISSEYWDQPELFRPERFSPDEKEHHVPLSYMPFGWGPRNCVGARFALMEVKMALLTILREYKFKPSSDTQIPLKTKMRLTLMPVNGIYLNVISK